MSIHAMGAVAFRTPELMLSEDEGKALAGAITSVAKYYPHHIDEKTIAWSNLLIVCIGLYGTRGVAIYGRLKTADQQPQARAVGMPPAQPGEVHHLNAGNGAFPPFVVPGRG